MNEIIVRNIEYNDIPKVVDIQIRGWQTAYRGMIDDEYLDTMSKEEKIKKRKKDYKENGFFVAEINNEVVGFCRYINNNKRTPETPQADCELMALYVEPNLKRRGIGKEMFKHVVDQFKKENKTYMVLWCLKENESAKRFYEKMGGEIIAKRQIEIKERYYPEVGYGFKIGGEKK